MVYVVVVTYNGAKWVDQCFGSLRNSSVQPRVIAVDNGSTDGTQELIEKRFPEVRLIRSAKNLGFGQGNNLGLEIAMRQGAEYIFLLNQDAWVEHTAIALLVSISQKHKNYGILSPLHLDGEGKQIDRMFLHHCVRSYNYALADDAFVLKRLQEVYPISFVNAAAWLLTRDCVKAIGGFDPVYTHYGEDEDYANRARKAGISIGLCCQAFAYHDRASRKGPDLLLNYKRIYVNKLVFIRDPNYGYFARKYTSVQIKLLSLFLTKIATGKPKQAIINLKVFYKLLTEYKSISRQYDPSFLLKE